MSNNLYAVLEWDSDNTTNARIIATDQSCDMAKAIVGVTPSHYFRDIISTEELKDLKSIEDQLYYYRI